MSDIIRRISAGLDRRFKHAASNRRIRRFARSVARHSHPEGDPVVVFNASTRLWGISQNGGFSLLSAWALRLSGVPVVHFVCASGLSPCVLGTNASQPEQSPPCKGCVRQSEAMYTDADVCWYVYAPDARLEKQIKDLSLVELMEVVHNDIPLGSLVLPSLRWILRRHHLVDDEPTRHLYRQYILSAASLVAQFEALINKVHPRAVLVFNGMFYPEASARWVAQKHGLPVVSHEVGLRPFTGFFTRGDATAYPIQIPDDFELSQSQNERLDQYLEQRFKGNFSMAGVRFWKGMQPLSDDVLKRMEGYKGLVPVFTNVIFDTSQSHANVIFPHMFAWLDAVLELIKTHPDVFFVIRAHPDEGRKGKEARESVAGWAESRDLANLPNVLFVGSHETISSYELIQRARFVMVYNSTIGLEASLLGAAVLCAGKARFTQLPTAFFPQTESQYMTTATDFLAADEVKPLPEFQKNARRFLYYQLFKTSLPFDGLLQEDGVWNGYVMLKEIKWQELLPENSATVATILDGLLNDGDFLLPERENS